MSQLQPLNTIFGENYLPFPASQTCHTSNGYRPHKIPQLGYLSPDPHIFYCRFRHCSMSWMLCQKMSSLPQTVWKLQRFKVWIVISVCFLHPCSYFLPTLRKLFFDQKPCIRGQNWEWLFSISEYLNIFDASTLFNGFLKPKISILGG